MQLNPISFVVAVNDEEVFKNNVLASPIFLKGHHHEIIIKKGFSSASLAYNDAISNAHNEIMVFMHQDVYLPANWDKKLYNIISSLGSSGCNWGALGCFGKSLKGESVGYVFSNGLNKLLGFPQGPILVQSLDEFLIILRKSNQLFFDPSLLKFHLYGTDICLQANQLGLENYVISNFCLHNSLPVMKLDKNFWQCAEYLRKKWQEKLPIKTPCVILLPSRPKMLINKIKMDLRLLKSHKEQKSKIRIKNPDDYIRNIVNDNRISL